MVRSVWIDFLRKYFRFVFHSVPTYSTENDPTKTTPSEYSTPFQIIANNVFQFRKRTSSFRRAIIRPNT